MSAEDRRAIQNLKETTMKVGDRYQVGLLWKTDDVRLPNNYHIAYHRLLSTEKSMSKNPEKAAAYDETLMGYVEKGYARKLTQEEVTAAKVNPKTCHMVSPPSRSFKS